jgi:hypothetical protein
MRRMWKMAGRMGLWGVLMGLGAVLGVGQGMTAVGAVGATGAGDCARPAITEVYTNYKNDRGEQFVEFFNPTAEVLSLEGCVVRTKYGGKVLQVEFGEVLLQPEEYRAYSLQSLGLRLAKSPTVERVVELWGGLSEDGGVGGSGGSDALMALSVDLADLPKSAAGKSWALVDGKWVNATPTPSAGNKTAPELQSGGEVDTDSSPESPLSVSESAPISPAALAPIKYKPSEVSAGSKGSAAGSAARGYAACGEGRYRNPETNRCKKIEAEAESELKPCAEGYERNAETNRCRKVRENTGVAVGFGVPDSGGEAGDSGGAGSVTGASAPVAVLAAVGGVLITGVAVCWVFREKLRKVPAFTGVIGAIERIYERVYGKIVAIRRKIAEKY